jgi:PIN domain nuclease of toxin-antitoxin system
VAGGLEKGAAVRLLLDTNALLWLLMEPERLPDNALEIVESTANDVHVSVVSIWEIEIKAAKNNLETPPDLEAALAKQRFDALPVTMRHVLAVESLPRHHRDPFDRMLIAQAQIEGLTIVTSDRTMRRYPVATLSAT